MSGEYKVIEDIILQSVKDDNSSVTIIVDGTYPNLINLIEYLSYRGFSTIIDNTNHLMKIYW